MLWREVNKMKKWRLKRIGTLKILRTKGERSPYDVWGSYTGTPMDGEQPVQDADDL